MAFFKKKRKEEISDEDFEDIELPALPEELPDMPPLPSMPPMKKGEMLSEFESNQLPPPPRDLRAPPSSLGVPRMNSSRSSEPREIVQPSQFEQPPSPERVMPDNRAQVFVRLDKYRQAIKTIENMQRKMAELQETLKKISAIKNKEAEIIEGWAALLMEAKDKVDEVNSKLLRPSEL